MPHDIAPTTDDKDRDPDDTDAAMEAHEDELARRHAEYMERELMRKEPQ